jgi:hypothetical protein
MITAALPMGTVDLGDVAALITGVTTLAVVLLTYSMARATSKSAAAAQQASELAEKQLQESHRPLLVPLDLTEAEKETLLRVRNIGVGPALRIYAKVTTRNMPEGVIGRFPLNQLPGVEASSEVSLPLTRPL